VNTTELIKKSFTYSGTLGQITGTVHILELACGLWIALLSVKLSKSSMRKVTITVNSSAPITTLSICSKKWSQKGKCQGTVKESRDFLNL
jgi:hypothetical protein